MIVFELGDGLLGAYGVEAILAAPDIRESFSAVILSANDPVAAWGGVKLLRERFGIEPAPVTGPSTDNAVGVDIIPERLNVPAFNALANGAALGDCVIAAAGLDKVAHSGEIEAAELTARVPAIILGGTGYVAGELLRLTLGHPRLELAAIASDSQPGEPVASVPRTSQRPAATCVTSRCGRSSRRGTASEKRSPRGRATRRFPQADRRPAHCRRRQWREARRRRYFCGLPLRGPRPSTNVSTSTRTAPRRARRNSPARCPSTSTARRHRTSPIRAASSPPRCSRSCRCSSSAWWTDLFSSRR